MSVSDTIGCKADNAVDIIKNKDAHAWKYVADEVCYMNTGLGTMAVPKRNRCVDIVAPPTSQ
jgi:hypothetical protein